MSVRVAAVPAALSAQILTTDFWELMLPLWDEPKLWRQPGSVVCGQAGQAGHAVLLLLLLLEAPLHLRV